MLTKRAASLLSLSEGSPLRNFAQNVLRALQSLDPSTRESLWGLHCSANLAGQKALTSDAFVFAPNTDVRDGIIALRTCFVVFAKLVSVTVVCGRDWYPRALASYADAHQELFIDVVSGRKLASEGIIDNDDSLEYGWVKHVWDSALAMSLRDTASIASELIDDLATLSDPFQHLYPRLLPARLLHATGEFYTPFWMAELLLRDTNWDGTSSLVDPYCGSGVFLLAALDHAVRLGIPPTQCLRYIRGIEINSAACAGARANLLLRLRPFLHGGESISLPIYCADAILPEHRPPETLFQTPSPQTTFNVHAARSSVLVTNPPWVGWEYIPRDYRDSLEKSWLYYGLFTARGLDKSFLKEDLSSLAVAVALDQYLTTGGIAALVMRPASMRSNLAGRELRRMRLAPGNIPLGLTKIREFKFRTFSTATVPAAAWVLKKGLETTFPVPVESWSAMGKVSPQEHLVDLEPKFNSSTSIAHPITPDDPTSAWLIEDATHHMLANSIRGKCEYQGRVGVFTGGANGVFYVERVPGTTTRFRNVTERAKRHVPDTEAELEPELVYEIVRGRDIELWRLRGVGYLLFPHTIETRMDAISPSDLATRYPNARKYLASQRIFLSARKGFTQWERPYFERAYYCLQRIGAYTFAPFKVCWKFVSSRFDCVVVGPDASGRPRLANDKVMFIGVDNEEEAFYLCGILSSELFRRTVMGSNTSTQISTSAISSLAIRKYDSRNILHNLVSRTCRNGHRLATAHKPPDPCLAVLNDLVIKLYDPNGAT